MDIIEVIRTAESAPKVISALSVYIESLRNTAVIPESLLRLSLKGADDVGQRMAALLDVIDLASRDRRDRDCGIAKDALQVFAAAAWRLRTRQHGNLH